MTTVPHSTAETASVPPRPRVLAMPSPTVSRSLVLVAALLSAGLFVGTWVHNQTGVGADWVDQVRECQEQRADLPPGADPAEALAAEESFLRCAEGAQQRLALFALGGVAAAAVAGLVVLAMVPKVVQRRRRLRPAGEKLAAAEQRVTTLAGESGLRRTPRVLIGPAKVRDAFSFGLPGRYRVVLPPALAVRWRDRSVFDPLVRHELAHLARHDVLIAWSARAVWCALLPMLAAPVVWGIVRADLSLLPSYAWRAALLVAVAFVASASILRSREYDADLTSAATAEQRAALAGLLGRARPRATGWRRVAAYHPDRDDRIAALEQPGRIARISFLDGALAGFLASLTVPLLVSVFATVPSITRWAYAVPAILVGPLLGATVGLGLWRLALVERVAGEHGNIRASAGRAAAAVFVGYVVGEATSLAQVGSNQVAALHQPAVMVISAVALGGATMVAGGLAVLFADVAPRLSAHGFTAAGVVLCGSLFALVLWAATTVRNSLELGGWQLVRPVVVTLLTQRWPAAVAAAIALVVLAAVWLVRPGAPGPAWAVDAQPVITWPVPAARPGLRQIALSGLGSGVAGASAILVFRLLAGPPAGPAEQLQRLDTYVWVFSGAGAVTGLALLAGYGLRGLATGLLAAPIGSTVAAVGFLLINQAYGAALNWTFAETVIRPGLSLGVLLLVMASILAVLPFPGLTRRATATTVVLAVVLSGAVGGCALVARDALSPLPEVASSEVGDYAATYMPVVYAELAAVEASVQAIDSDPAASPLERAQRVRREIVAPVERLRSQAADLEVAAGDLAEAHQNLIDALDLTAAAFEDFARAYETGDGALFARAQRERLDGQRQLQAWSDAVTTLAADEMDSD